MPLAAPLLKNLRIIYTITRESLYFPFEPCFTGNMGITSHLSDAVERMLAASDLSARTESVYHYLHEQSLTTEEKAYIIDRLMPRRNTYVQTNESLVTESFIEDFFAYRSMGMNLRDTASLLNVSYKRLEELLCGVGLTEGQHKRLLARAIRADAMCKYTHLDVVTQASKAGDWKAALALLERKYPDEYGLKQKVTNEVTANVTLGTTECENRALSAQKKLREIRQSRQEAEDGSE